MGHDSKDVDTKNECRNYAWDWFSYHAKQRLDVFRFYLIVIALVFAGALRAIEVQQFFVSVVLCLFLIFSTFLFFQLDKRNSALVKLGEKYLKVEEERLCELTGVSEIKVVHQADSHGGKFFTSFSQIFRSMFLAVTLLGAAVFSYSVVQLY